MKETEDEPWFKRWFNTSEYHTLYGHRDENEAHEFVSVLDKEFGFKDAQILDAGCGAGRHVHAWGQLGYKATGFDLSPNSINSATQRALELNLESKVQFHVEDLRNLKNSDKWDSQFDIVTNLFTSFGYFIDEEDHISVVKGFASALKTGGKLVFDYLNPEYSLGRLIPKETISNEGIDFHIKREFKDGFFQKNISFTDTTGIEQTHTELVKAWSAGELTKLFTSVGLQIQSVYGDYNLSNYEKNSPRLIIIAEKE
jgi:SAM-dependent methyltransferase